MTDEQSLKTNFLQNQAKESATPAMKSAPVRIVLFLVGMGILVGAFQLVMFVVNFDQIQAIKNVEVVLDNPGLMNGIATVNVKVTNLNPVVISDMALRYTITGPDGASASSGTVNIPDRVPPGDARTFRHVKLGPLTDEAHRMHADLVGLRLGPKGKLSAEQALRFTEISGLKDDEARKAFEEFVKSAPDFAPAYICLGRASMALDDYAEAARSFEQAARLEPGNADAHLNLGRALMKKGDKQAACKELQAAYDLTPDDPDVQRTIQLLRD